MIDADVHIPNPRLRDLYPLLPDHWVEHFNNTVDKGASQEYYPPRSPVAGSRGGLAELREAVFEQGGAELAISSCLYAVDSVHNPDVAAALATATNDWQSREWLDREPRLRGSIVAPIQLPAAAAEEIERCADRPGFVQVLIPVRTEHPLGSRLYHPLWKTIEQSGLVAAIHFGGAPVMPPTPTGWPSFFLEEYTAMAQVFATQLTSMIAEGVFDACPDLRVVFLESGFTWIPSHLWRMDKEWRNLRRLVPWGAPPAVRLLPRACPGRHPAARFAARPGAPGRGRRPARLGRPASLRQRLSPCPRLRRRRSAVAGAAGVARA